MLPGCGRSDTETRKWCGQMWRFCGSRAGKGLIPGAGRRATGDGSGRRATGAGAGRRVPGVGSGCRGSGAGRRATGVGCRATGASAGRRATGVGCRATVAGSRSAPVPGTWTPTPDPRNLAPGPRSSELDHRRPPRHLAPGPRGHILRTASKPAMRSCKADSGKAGYGQ
jgi:hypothetical protein